MIIQSASGLESALALLDIPAELAREAADEYRRVCVWLGEESSPLSNLDPELYPQGSFRLGTPIRPLLKSDEFDIDLVCRLELSKDRISQRELKRIVGDRLKADPETGEDVSESRRCWTIGYPNRFHMDVLPALPDEEQGGTGIILTDRDLVRWQFSNPIGYSEWFFDRMRPLIMEGRTVLAEAANVSIEEIPEWQVRTPLQRVVQFLKRHRDLRFAAQPDLRPPSILLTTLAGVAYRQERDLLAALSGILSRFELGVTQWDGHWEIPNPAHPLENFADKWNEYPERREAFDRWLDVVRADTRALFEITSERDLKQLSEQILRPPAGLRTPSQAVAVPGLESTSHTRAPLWPAAITHTCSITARVHRQLRVGKTLWKMDGGIVPKGMGLKFVATTSTPAPFEVKWQVVNTGQEARQAGQLRGGFDDGDSGTGTTRWEHTAYLGTHTVQAFVVKGGKLVARSNLVRVRVGTQGRTVAPRPRR